MAQVDTHKTLGAVWHAGELIAGHETHETGDRFSVVICTKQRILGPRGGVKEPAEFATITDPSWGHVCDAVEELGFTRPTLTEQEVLHPSRR